jgi:hypothetical protein
MMLMLDLRRSTWAGLRNVYPPRSRRRMHPTGSNPPPAIDQASLLDVPTSCAISAFVGGEPILRERDSEGFSATTALATIRWPRSRTS